MWYNAVGRKTRRNTYTVAAPRLKGRISASPYITGGEGCPMFITLEQLLLIGTFLIALAGYWKSHK
ncbi:MAG: hypothetical protein IJX39_04675 [Clostridia bacterium]|nr:hypothetical protein [Clostridia bacterium]